MIEKGKLIKWEPLGSSIFDRFLKPMYLEMIEFDGELKIIVGPENNRYQIKYERNEEFFYPVRTHRISIEQTRMDFENLIEQRFHYLKENSLPLPSNNSTFYKIDNSTFLNWYVSVDDSIPELELANLEHHLYITDDYFIEVLAAVQPTIIKLNG